MYKLEITDDMSDLEKFVRQEADNYVNSTMFLSVISEHHPNIDSVVEKGKEVTPYVVKLCIHISSFWLCRDCMVIHL